MNRWQEYPYLGEFSAARGEIVYRPTLGLKIRKDDMSTQTVGILDSGSDVTVINSEFAEFLGVDYQKCKKGRIGGVMGSGEAFIAEVEIILDKFEKLPVKTIAFFVEGMVANVLLGQRDIFNAFQIQFEKRKNRFYIRR